jgi:hypothetical protein
MRNSKRPFRLPNNAYVQHSAVLAARLDADAWVSVLGAYEMADELNWQVEEMDKQLGDDDKMLFRAPWLAVRYAEEALAKLDMSPERFEGRLAAQRRATAEQEEGTGACRVASGSESFPT